MAEEHDSAATAKLASTVKKCIFSMKLARPNSVPSDSSSYNSTLVLAHVIFRHGNRTPNGKDELYPTDPHYNKTYYPLGLGQLTKLGKQKMYEVGLELRCRYNSFLGDVVYPGLVDATSTNFSRTKASLQYCLAGLFPPKGEEIWNPDLNWQAIPIYSKEVKNDKELLGVESPTYFKLYNENRHSDKFQKEFSKYKEQFDYINKNSGLNVTSFWEIYLLYFGIQTEEEYGLEMPQWLDKIWPDTLTDLTVKQYAMATATKEMNKLSSGYFLKKLVKDTETKIKEKKDGEFKKKLYLYSAHDSNLAMLLISLNIFNNTIPKYGSYVAFEVHKIDGIYGFKINYQNYEHQDPVLLKIPGCEEFCPLDKFTKIFEDILPLDSE